MTLTPKVRGVMLAGALALTLAAVFMGPPAEVGAVVGPPERTHPKVPESPSAERASDNIPRIIVTRIKDGTPMDDPFASKPINVEPPPSQPTLLPPSAPKAPPLPYAYLGKMIEDGKTVIFLGKQDNNYSVRVGETLEGQYRLDEVNDQTITLVYLPLNEKQVLSIGREVN